MEDQSILNRSTQETQTYLNDLAIAVCVNGDKLEKYEKVTTRQCGEEAFANMKLFVEEVQRSVERGKFTNTSKINLGYLGKNAGVSDETITMIVEECEQRIKIDPQKEENEFWLNCKTLQDYKMYLSKYPNGTYKNSAQTKIDELVGTVRNDDSDKPQKKIVWPWVAVAFVALIASLVVLLHKPNHKMIAVDSVELQQQQSIDSIEKLLGENEELYRKASIEPYDLKRIEPYDLDSYKKWLPTLNRISENFWAVHWLLCKHSFDLPEEIYDNYCDKNERLWSIGYKFVNELYNKECEKQNSKDERVRKEGKKRIELLEQCGLLYPE